MVELIFFYFFFLEIPISSVSFVKMFRKMFENERHLLLWHFFLGLFD